MALFLLVRWGSFSNSTFRDKSESMRFSTDCVFLFEPFIADRMNSLMFRLTVCELIRRFCANTWLESGTADEIVGIFWWTFDSSVSVLDSLLSLRLNLLTLLLMLFRRALATRRPTARLYDGGGEYFGGASLFTSKVFWFAIGTITAWTCWARFCWHSRRMGKCEIDGSAASIGGRNKSSIRCKLRKIKYR